MARRRGGRHTRRSTRVTPRRWLPFLALLAVIAGAVVVTAQSSDPEPPPTTVAAPSGVLPVTAAPGALSSAWYCTGTARGEGGAAELAVVIANLSERGTSAELVVTGSNGERRRTTVLVPANGRTLVPGTDLLSSAWVGVTVEVLGGRATVARQVVGPQGIDVSPCSSAASSRWYVPSGSTVQGATEHLVLYNPFPDASSVDISFATDAGRRAPVALQGFSVPARSVRVVPPDLLPDARPELATRVIARTGRLVVDRVQTFDGTGDPLGGGEGGGPATDPAIGLAATAAIPATSPRWLFLAGVEQAGTRTQVGIYNPGSEDAEIDVVLTYERPGLFPELEPIQLTIRAGDEAVVDLTAQGGLELDTPYTIDVRSLDDVPVVAEQLVHGAVPLAGPPPAPAEESEGTGPDEEEGEAEEAPPEEEAEEAPEAVTGFAAVPGSPVAAREWVLASKGDPGSRTAAVVVANPGARSVTVLVSEVASGSRTAIEGATVEIPAGDRRVLELADATANATLVVRASGPVVVAQVVAVAEGPGIAHALATPTPESVVRLPD